MNWQSKDLKDFSTVGLKTRLDIHGEEWVSLNMENMTEWDRYWQQKATNTNWNQTWARGIIPVQTLSLVNLSMLAAIGHWGEFEHHFRNALNRTKVPLIQLREVMLHISQYRGMTTGGEIWKIARRVLREEGVDLSQLPPLDPSTLQLDDFDEVGVRVRREILGDDWVDANLSTMTEWDRHWQILATNTNWATTWARGIIPQQSLSLVNISVLAAIGQWSEFEHHFRNALLRTKVPLIQLREIMLHISQYCGMCTGGEIWKIARRVLKEENVDLSTLPPIQSTE
jgi:4-carboxymuconolactone decarboxylase